MYCRILDAESPILLWLGAGNGSHGRLADTGDWDISYTWGDISAFSGENGCGHWIFSALYPYGRNPADPGTKTYRKPGGTFSPAGPSFGIFGSNPIRGIRICAGATVRPAFIWNIQGMGFAAGMNNYKDFSKTLKNFYKQCEIL